MIDRVPAMPDRTINIDVIVESPHWDGVPAAAEPWVRRVVEAALPAQQPACDLAVVFADDHAIRALNARFRGRDAATNVLSFPPPSAALAPAPGETMPLGDVVIAFETAQAEAAAEGKEFLHHVSHLLVHGVLHLLGYDHHTDAEADSMEMCERAILDGLGIADPYAESGAGRADAMAVGGDGPAAPTTRLAGEAAEPEPVLSRAAAPQRA